MNKDDLIKKLENLDLPEVELPSHQRRLKMALLSSGYWKEKNAMSLLKKFAPIGAVAVIALLVVVGASYFKNPSSQVAYAKEIAQKSYQTIVNLPADQQAKISASLGMDSRTILQEAYNAKDLQALTYDEFAGQEEGPLPPDPDGKLRTLKFLRFTNADGQIITLGIDQNSNLPMFVTGKNANPAGASGEKSFQTSTRTDKGLVNCTIENGVEKCTEVNE